MNTKIRNLINSINIVYQWNINSHNYDLKERVRKTIYHHPLLNRFVKYKEYSARESASGFEGWFEAPIIGCLAFKSSDGEGIRFRW